MEKSVLKSTIFYRSLYLYRYIYYFMQVHHLYTGSCIGGPKDIGPLEQKSTRMFKIQNGHHIVFWKMSGPYKRMNIYSWYRHIICRVFPNINLNWHIFWTQIIMMQKKYYIEQMVWKWALREPFCVGTRASSSWPLGLALEFQLFSEYHVVLHCCQCCHTVLCSDLLIQWIYSGLLLAGNSAILGNVVWQQLCVFLQVEDSCIFN